MVDTINIELTESPTTITLTTTTVAGSFTEASIDHTNIQNIGTNSHAQIDTFITNNTPTNSVISSNTTIGAGQQNVTIDTASITVTLASSPSAGDWVRINNDSGGSATIDSNGNNINGNSTVTILDGEGFSMFYNNSTWNLV